MSRPQKKFEPDSIPQNKLLFCPQKPKKNKNMTPKLSQNQMSELNETKKIKVIALYEPKKISLDQIKLKARIERDIENICCSTT